MNKNLKCSPKVEKNIAPKIWEHILKILENEEKESGTLDRIHIFNLSDDKEDGITIQRIIHKQTVQPYIKILEIPMESPVLADLYVIQSKNDVLKIMYQDEILKEGE